MSSTGLRKGRWLLLTLAVVAVAVAVPALKDVIREEWYIRCLTSEDVLEQADAIDKLGAMGSRRAVPHLCAIIEDERHGWTAQAPIDFDAEEPFIPEPTPGDDIDLAHEALQALRRIAPPPEVVLPSIYRSVEVGNHGGGRQASESYVQA